MKKKYWIRKTSRGEWEIMRGNRTLDIILADRAEAEAEIENIEASEKDAEEDVKHL